MKKSLLGLTAALAAFFCGIFATEAFRFTQKLISKPVAIEVKIIETPIVKIEPVEVEEEIETEEVSVNEEIISGWYLLDRYKGMDEVNIVYLSKDDSGSFGGVFTSFEKYGDQEFVDSAWAKVTKKKAKFRTNKIKGIEYRFEGTFFRNKTSGEEGEKVLRGTLQKFVKGKKVAETGGDFAYHEPQCWH